MAFWPRQRKLSTLIIDIARERGQAGQRERLRRLPRPQNRQGRLLEKLERRVRTAEAAGVSPPQEQGHPLEFRLQAVCRLRAPLGENHERIERRENKHAKRN